MKDYIVRTVEKRNFHLRPGLKTPHVFLERQQALEVPVSLKKVLRPEGVVLCHCFPVEGLSEMRKLKLQRPYESIMLCLLI